MPTTNATYGIPHPGTFILNAKGDVTSRFFESAYQERNTMTSVLVKLGAKIDVRATKMSAPHLTVTTTSPIVSRRRALVLRSCWMSSRDRACTSTHQA